MRDAGVKYPFLPHWFSEWYGISWAFVMEVHDRGGQVAEADSHVPLLTVDGPGGDTLRQWKRIWNDGLVPEEVLTYNESSFMEAFKSGEYDFIYENHSKRWARDYNGPNFDNQTIIKFN